MSQVNFEKSISIVCQDVSLVDLNLGELDAYSQIPFKSLQAQRFELGMDYYICLIKEGDHTHLFDAAQFIEHCVREHKVIKNPNTNLPIKDLEIRVSSRTHPGFRLYMKGEKALKTPNHLPILWNDPSQSLDHRLGFKYLYGKAFEEHDLEKSIQVYQEAAREGSTAAKIKLGILYSQLRRKESAIRYFCEAIRAEDISTQNILFCSQRLERYGQSQLVFEGYSLAASRGNAEALRKVQSLRTLSGSF